ARSLAAQHVDSPTVTVSEQIGTQRPPLGVEAVGLLPETEENLLGDLLGQGLLGEEPTGQGEHRPSVAAVGLGQRFLVIARDGQHQGAVASLLQSVDRHSMTCSTLSVPLDVRRCLCPRSPAPPCSSPSVSSLWAPWAAARRATTRRRNPPRRRRRP